MRISPIVFVTASLLAFGVPRALAQASSAAPAHISAVDGAATLERAGEVEPIVLNMPIVEGDRVRTSAGTVQILFPDGSAVDLDPNSEVEYLGGARIRIHAGTVENHPAIVLRSQSAEYLPSDSQAYATDLDQNGTWQYDTSYGNVWYPTVAAGWRPYYYGYWTSVPSYGWTWIGYNRWAWPTHHYGRWGYAHSRWFWIPGNVYSSAWVSWGTAPGYVSWCPLGYDSRPVAALSVGYAHGWNAWTIVPRDHFGWRGYPAHRYAIEPHHIAASTPFIVQRTQPSASIAGARTWASPSRSGSRAAEATRVPTFPRGGSGERTSDGFSRGNQTTAVPRGSVTNDRTASPMYRLPPAANVERRPAAAPQLSRPQSQPTPSPGSRAMERQGFSRTAPTPGASLDRRPIDRAPSPRTESPSSQVFGRPTMRGEGVSRAPAPASPRQGGGGGHAASGPHAERGPSGGSHGGGSHGGGSHGGGSQGTAVRRPR
jgi:hypothetical protein